jgi:hypothetical protein
MKSSGTLSTQVREGAIGIPKTADLYPLSFNEKDFDGIRGAMMVINPTFNNGSMWLGTGYQNLWQQPKSTTFSVQSGSGWELVAYTPSEVIYKKNHTGTGGAYKGWDIAITAGTTYTYSADIFVSEDFNGNSAPFMNNEQNSTGSLFYDLTKLGTWQTVSRTFTATVTGNCRCLIYPCAGSQTANKGYTMYRNVSFTATAFPVPFSYGSPTDSQLKYHLDSIVTSSMDWTVGVWTKPNTYHVGTNPSNEFVALSIGDTGMPGQGDAAIVFKWNGVSDTNRDWTLVTFNNEVDQSSAKVTMTAADLAGWILCVIRYNVSEGQLYGDIYGATGKKYSTTASNLIPAIVPYVDPGASQWDAYFRDLFTEARFITDAELDKIAKTNMRASKDRTTQVQGNILEWRQL